MTLIDRSIHIQADAESIMSYGLDSKFLADWFEGVSEQIPGDQWPHVGSTATNVYSAAGLRLENKLTVTEYSPGSALNFDLSGMISGTFRWIYTENEQDTQVRAILNYELAGGAIGKIANKVLFERATTANMEKSLENLKHFCENN